MRRAAFDITLTQDCLRSERKDTSFIFRKFYCQLDLYEANGPQSWAISTTDNYNAIMTQQYDE